MSLYLFSEPYRPEGNIDARAARRAIGRPHLDFWTLFLRETVQNSWDAKLSDEGPIAFSVDAMWADAAQRRVFRQEIFRSRPPNSGLAEFLESDEQPLLIITDRGTRGLEGPTRADVTTADRTDFVDFARNIGRAEDKGIGGGTYGFGKGVLYDASMCSTILVFTRTRAAGRLVARFMGIGLGASYSARNRRFTGRHWWGVKDATTGAEPVTGSQAESLAEAVGMPTIPRQETGTSIMVIGPVAHEGTETLQSIVEKISTAATWWAWPHMIGTGNGPTINFSFSNDGEPIQPLDPASHATLKHYVAAYRRALSSLHGRRKPQRWPWADVELNSERPPRRLGSLVYRRVERKRLAAGGDDLPDVTSHVALMRNPRLVVRYLEVPADPQGLATTGVFIADPALDGEFASSEPVAHDDWVPGNLRLEKYQRNPVKQALEKLRREFKQSATAVPIPAGDQRYSGLARIATTMGSLLEGQPGGTDARIYNGGGPLSKGSGGGRTGGGGSQEPPPSGRRGRHRGQAAVRVEGRPSLTFRGGERIVHFPVKVDMPSGFKTLTITAEPRVVLDGGTPEEVGAQPLGEDVPRLVGWLRKGSEQHLPGADLVLTESGVHEMSVLVRQPRDTAVTVHVRVKEAIS